MIKSQTRRRCNNHRHRQVTRAVHALDDSKAQIHDLLDEFPGDCDAEFRLGVVEEAIANCQGYLEPLVERAAPGLDEPDIGD